MGYAWFSKNVYIVHQYIIVNQVQWCSVLVFSSTYTKEMACVVGSTETISWQNVKIKNLTYDFK